MLKTAGALALAGMISARPASAQGFPSRAGGWDIVIDTQFCALSQTFEGPGATTMTFVYGHDGIMNFGLYNSGWTIAEGQEFDIEIEVGSMVYSGRARGLPLSGYKHGFGAPNTTSAEFLDRFAGAPTISFYRKEGDVRSLIDRLDLDGSRQAVTALRQCHAVGLRRQAAADAYRRRFADIPADPFIGLAGTSPVPTPTAPSTPAVQIGGTISNADIPPAAVREGISGTTRVSIQIGETGRVTGCSVTGSSGSSILDTTACSLIQVRFTFRPATRAGAPVASSQSRSITWRFPRDDPPPPVR